MEYSSTDPRNPSFVSAEDANRQHEEYECAGRKDTHRAVKILVYFDRIERGWK